MLVFCCGMYRSGSTLQYQLAGEIVEFVKKGRLAGYWGDWGKGVSSYEEKARLMEEKGLVIVKNHTYERKTGEMISEGKAKAIYVYRDLRDVVVSAMNKEGKPFLHIFENQLRWALHNSHGWLNTNNILVSKYENMITDLSQEILKIANYLGISLDRQTADIIAGKYSIDKQKKRIGDFNYNEFGVKSREYIWHPDYLLHPNHIFSGESGQWTRKLSRLQVALIEEYAGNWLVKRGYTLNNNLFIRKASKLLYYLQKSVSS